MGFSVIRFLNCLIGAGIMLMCAVPTSSFSAQDVPSYGGTLVWGTINPPTIINPVLTYQGVSSSLMSLIFNALVRVNAQGEIIPDLAESWDVSEDGLIYVFHLKRGVHFHDGVELTAEDVKFTYEAIEDPRNESQRKDRTSNALVGQWQVIDQYTVKFSLKAANKFVLYKLAFVIAPMHLLTGQKMSEAAFNWAPVGSGPFRFKAWDHKTQEIVLEANPYYFEGRPFLDRIVVKVYPDNTSLWAALMRQEVDLVKFLNREDYEVLRKDKLFKTYEISSGICSAIVFDLHDPLLADIRVRKAIAMGINVDRMLNDIRLGGVPGTGIFESGSSGFNPDIKPFAYDPQEARRLLEAVGWKDLNGDGILEKEGKALEIKMLVEGRSGYYQVMAMVIRQQLSEIGVKLVVDLYQDEKAFTQAYLSAHKPQAWLRSFVSFIRDPGIALEQWYPSGDLLQKLWNYKNPELDALIVEAKTSSDKVLQSKVYQKIHKVIYDDQPACFLFSFVTRHAVARKFSNTDGFFFPLMPVYLIKDWYLSPVSH